ncbi:ATP-dependent DNA helicase PIF1-like [Asparagus officinalis]|nr:ATP-dependent DNA helicase PIF1-like [Asparagus officinalis]
MPTSFPQLHPPSTPIFSYHRSTAWPLHPSAAQKLNSFAGIGLGNGSLDSLLLKVSANESAAARWSLARALVIDEISMIDGQLFDRLDQIARAMRPQDADLPWGGVQLIVSGDFFQLPPVNAPNPSKEFAFEAECWTNSFHLQVELTRIFRQSDSALIDVLQGIRRGQKGNCLCHILEHHCSKPLSSYNDDADDDDRTTRLFPRNEDVKKLNNERLKNLDAVIFHYTAVDRGKEPWKAQLKQGIAPEELEICTGARVMLIKNTDVGMGLVNGATGTVEGFVFDDSLKVGKICRNGGFLPRVKFDSGVELVVKPERWDLMEGEKIRATRKQIPLILAWALSVHKCQGMTLDRLHTDLSRAFGCGMVYVALSRVRSLAGLRLSGFNPYKIRAHPKVVRFYDWLLLSHRP